MEILPFLLNNVIEPYGYTVLSWLIKNVNTKLLEKAKILD